MVDEEQVMEAAQPILDRIAEDEEGVSEQVAKVLRYLRRHLFDVGFGAADVKRHLGKKAKALTAAFAGELGIRLDDYIAEAQLEAAVRLLVASDLSITRISRALGYPSTSAFRNTVERYFDLSPGRLRAEARAAGTRQGLRFADPTPPCSPLPPAERARIARRLAEEIWKFLARLPFSEGVEFLRHQMLFGGPELFELLSRHSRELGREDRRRGAEVAELGLATVEASAPLLAEDFDHLHALALARLGNARWLAGDPEGASEALQRVEEVGPDLEDETDPRLQLEILALKATLRLSERRFEEALELLDRAVAIAPKVDDAQLHAQTLLRRAALHGSCDRPGEMLGDLEQIRKLAAAQAESDPVRLLEMASAGETDALPGLHQAREALRRIRREPGKTLASRPRPKAEHPPKN